MTLLLKKCELSYIGTDVMLVGLDFVYLHLILTLLLIDLFWCVD